MQTQSSSPYHRPNRSHSRREDGQHGQHIQHGQQESHGRHGQHGQHSQQQFYHGQQNQAGQLSGTREGRVKRDECLPDDIDCFKCECYQNLKQTGCDPGKIDQNSRVLFPLTFLLLNIIYWTYYIVISDVSAEDLINQDIAALSDS